MFPRILARHLLALPVAALIAGAAQMALADDWALNGMDVVELRDGGRLAAGRPDVATHWRGLDWLFTAESHRSAFEADPRRYAPAFRGLCPVQLAEGRATQGRAEFALVVGGRLYLVSSETGRAAMAADPARILDRATQTWQALGD